jgi:DNA-binding CsgD family transcriptional regulator/HD-like signal output (HDOD) protein
VGPRVQLLTPPGEHDLAGRSGGPLPRANRLALAFRAVEAFPALVESRDRVLAALDAAPGPDRGAIAAAVLSDLGLAIPVLRATLRVAGPEGVASVAEAVERLDPEALRAVCVTVPVYDVLGRPGRWADAPYRYLRHVVAVQRAVRRLAAVMRRPDTEVLATAAVLHDVGKLALAHAEGRPEEPFADRRAPESRRGQAPSGMDDAAVGGILLRRWGLPRAVWGPVERRYSDGPDQGVSILRLADLVARHDRGQGVDRGALLRAARTAGVGEDLLRDLLHDQAGVVAAPAGRVACPLTPCELEALRGLARGLRYKEIAAELGVQPSTVGSHLHKVYAKTGAADRAQAVLLAKERGWLDA